MTRLLSVVKFHISLTGVALESDAFLSNISGSVSNELTFVSRFCIFLSRALRSLAAVSTLARLLGLGIVDG